MGYEKDSRGPKVEVGIVYSARVFIWLYHGNEDPDGEQVESSAKSREDKS